MTKVEEYREVAPRGAVDIILRLGERLRGRRFLHVSSGRFGGGSAEILGRLVPLTADLGIDANWEITGGDPEFYATARAIQLALQGEEHAITDAALDHYVEMNRINAKKLSLEADLVLVHDVQPASLIFDRPAAGKWLWRCHFDCASPQRSIWRFFRPMIERYDGAIFSMPKFIRRLGIPHFVIHPSIDPLSDKNRDLPRREVAVLMAALGIPTDRPLLVQIGPFRRSADPLGVVNAYRLVRKYHDVRLVLAGPRATDPESVAVLAEARRAADDDGDIHVRELPPDAHLQINALQRAATIVLQKSVRDDFSLNVAEAMWKGKPVVGGATGGLTAQIIYDVTGYTVGSVEGAAFRVCHLLNNRELIARMGAAGREHVRRSFLVTRHLTDYLALLAHLGG
jgi:trehalose synthase